MLDHEDYDKWFMPAVALAAEGARIGLASCRVCGAVILLDPRDSIDQTRLHVEWHDDNDAARAKEGE